MRQGSISAALAFFLSTAWTATGFSADWRKETVFEGAAKPSLAVGVNNRPTIAFLLESRPGFVGFGEKREGQWRAEQVSKGHFYGPIDVIVAGGRPVVNYHDHDLEDQVVAMRDGGAWSLNRINHPGHDGWDNTLGLTEMVSCHRSCRFRWTGARVCISHQRGLGGRASRHG